MKGLKTALESTYLQGVPRNVTRGLLWSNTRRERYIFRDRKRPLYA